MTQAEFNEYYKKNKLVVLGVPLIVGILLTDMFFLKPRREAARLAKLGIKTPAVATADAAAKPSAAKEEPSAGDLVPPPDFAVPKFAKVADAASSRVLGKEVYDYGPSRNVFSRPAEEPAFRFAEVKTETPSEPQGPELPDISYHGFFRMGSDRVAILRICDRLVLSKAGQKLAYSSFQLSKIHPDRIQVADTAIQDRVLEIALKQPEAPPGERVEPEPEGEQTAMVRKE